MALTGVGVCMPLILIIAAFAALVGSGGSPRASIYMGKGDHDTAEKILTGCLSLQIIVSIILTVILLIWNKDLLLMFGASENTITYATAYMNIYAIGTIFVQITLGMNTFITAQGKATTGMMTVLIGAVANIILDPILIFGMFGLPRMGVAGAAAATVAGQMVAAVLAVSLNHLKNKEVRIQMKGFRPNLEIIGQIYEIGLPAIVMQAIGSAMNYGMNRILITFSSTATAVFGVYFKLQSFVFMPVFGLNNGVTPIIAYNYGAQSRERVVSAIRHVVTYAVIVMLLGLAAFQLLPKQLLLMFDASETMLALGIPALRIISLSFVLASFGVAASGAFQALGKSIYSMYVSVARQLVVLLPAAFLLAQTGRVELVWWAFPIAELVSFAMSVIFMVHINRKIISKIGKKS